MMTLITLLPGGERRGAWKWQRAPTGPVGLLLENTHMIGGSLQLPQFVFRTDAGADINVLTDPYDHLQPALQDLAFQAVQYDPARNRTVLHDCPRFDRHIHRSSVAAVPADTQEAVYGASTLSIADQGYVHKVDEEQSGLCVF